MEPLTWDMAYAVTAPAVGLAFALWAALTAVKIQKREQRRCEEQKRLSQISRLVRWWRDQDQDFRGKGVVSPHEILLTVQELAEGKPITRKDRPELFHECGCSIYEKGHLPWIPPSIVEMLERAEVIKDRPLKT